MKHPERVADYLEHIARTSRLFWFGYPMTKVP